MSVSNLDSRDRLLNIAQDLFAEKGYVGTTLRDISSKLGITHASLYYHFPGGKEELYVEVTEQTILKHGKGLAEFMQADGPSLRGKLRGAARWLLSSAPMDLMRMSASDMPALKEEAARHLMDLVYVHMIVQLRDVVAEAVDKGEIGEETDSGLIGGAFLGLVESLYSIPEFALTKKRIQMANELIDIILKGLDYKE
ncbi:hypothetical protein MASR2M78_17280 [Treponema sp.]